MKHRASINVLVRIALSCAIATQSVYAAQQSAQIETQAPLAVTSPQATQILCLTNEVLFKEIDLEVFIDDVP